MKIYLFCSAGMSTSLLVSKMKKVATDQNISCEIEAFAESTISKYGPEADVILIGPQIRFKEKKIKEQFPNKPVEAIDMRAYGLVDGETVLKRALELKNT